MRHERRFVGAYWLHFVGAQENDDDGDMLIVDHRPIVSDRRGQGILTDEETGIANSLNESTNERAECREGTNSDRCGVDVIVEVFLLSWVALRQRHARIVV